LTQNTTRIGGAVPAARRSSAEHTADINGERDNAPAPAPASSARRLIPLVRFG
jgi:hypothetical protein